MKIPKYTSAVPRVLCCWPRQRKFDRAGLLLISESSITVARKTWVFGIRKQLSVIPVINSFATRRPSCVQHIVGQPNHLKASQSASKEGWFQVRSNPSLGRERDARRQTRRLLLMILVKNMKIVMTVAILVHGSDDKNGNKDESNRRSDGAHRQLWLMIVDSEPF